MRLLAFTFHIYDILVKFLSYSMPFRQPLSSFNIRKGFVFDTENNKEIPFIIMNTKMKNGQMTMENFIQVEKFPCIRLYSHKKSKKKKFDKLFELYFPLFPLHIIIIIIIN